MRVQLHGFGGQRVQAHEFSEGRSCDEASLGIGEDCRDYKVELNRARLKRHENERKGRHKIAEDCLQAGLDFAGA